MLIITLSLDEIDLLKKHHADIVEKYKDSANPYEKLTADNSKKRVEQMEELLLTYTNVSDALQSRVLH